MIRFFLLFFILGCSHVFYLPADKIEHHHPSKKSLVFEEINLKTKDESIHGWYFPSKKPRALVLFFHGNANNLSSHYLTLSWLPLFNIDYFIFDYPGYGKSSGEPTQENTVESGKVAIEWARKKALKLNVPLVVFAQSLGGAIALRSLSDSKELKPLAQIIIDSSFLSYQSAANRAMRRGWLTWPFQWLAYLLVSDKYAPEKKLNTLKDYPLLVIHGKKDEVVNYELGKEIYESFEGDKQLWSIEEGKHTDVFWTHRREYKGKFLKLIRKLNTAQ